MPHGESMSNLKVNHIQYLEKYFCSCQIKIKLGKAQPMVSYEFELFDLPSNQDPNCKKADTLVIQNGQTRRKYCDPDVEGSVLTLATGSSKNLNVKFRANSDAQVGAGVVLKLWNAANDAGTSTSPPATPSTPPPTGNLAKLFCFHKLANIR